MKLPALTLLIALTVLLFAAGSARASFEPIQLISKSAIEQADEALAPAISADGRYVAFQGSIDGLKGVFRKDLVTGAVEEVAAASAYGSDPRTDASAPSISADGRYVSFTTTANLDPSNDQSASSSDVYVADMASAPPSYELASALDGCDPRGAPTPSCGLTYTSSSGSVASGRVALSADGHEVVFVTRSASNLLGAAGGTPPLQVVLRDLETNRTTLVSVSRNPESGQEMDDTPVPGGAVRPLPGLTSGAPGAALSADGSTVAWLGIHLSAQVAMASGEGGGDEYNEPLWRRFANGPTAPTRRIVGGPDGPFTSLGGDFGSCTGIASPGWLTVAPGFSQEVDGLPQLSADGRTVALIGEPNGFGNVFVVDMADGLNRLQAVRQLTREVPIFDPCRGITNVANIPNAGMVFDLAISPDGRRIAFATARQQFPLTPPNLIGSPPPALGLTELYRIDLGAETLERVTREAGGEGPSLGSGLVERGSGASSPAFDGDGHTLAFASTASNLAGGDANGASDVFTVAESPTEASAGELDVSPPPQGSVRKRQGRLVLSASSRADGSVRLVALVPGAGVLRARASTLPDIVAPGAKPVASARRRADGEGLLVLHLRPARRFLSYVRSREGLAATLRVGLSRPRRKALRGELEVRFRSHHGTVGRRGGPR